MGRRDSEEAPRATHAHVHSTAPGEGERRAVGGYGNQYRVAGLLIVDAIDDLEWIRIADPAAGRVDDIQVATTGRLDAHQVKWGRTPGTVTWRSLMRASGKTPSLVRQLADGWRRLQTANPGRRVVVHLITNGLPSVSVGRLGSLERFLHEGWSRRGVGRGAVPGEWIPAWDAIAEASGLNQSEFEQFVTQCELELGYSMFRSPFSRADDGLPVGVTDVANLLWQLVASPERIIEVPRAELLNRLGWTGLFRVRHHHDFPIDRKVYRAPPSARLALERLLDDTGRGYVAVVGPPGSGKSSLLTETLRVRPERVVRYYAFVPGDSSAALRGEALSFLHDTVVRLRRLGFGSRELLHDDRDWLQRELGLQLQHLGQRFSEHGERTILLIDGMDHATRDPLPERALMGDLPEPAVVPPGVLIVLGTQTTDLPNLSANIQTQVRGSNRRLELGSLDSATVDAVIDGWDITPAILADERRQIHRLSAGHPLTLAYVLRQIADAPTVERARRLDSAPAYEGDLWAYYESHWRSLERDPDVASALIHVARLRGSIDIPWLVDHLDAPGVGTRLADRAGHYFRRPASERWAFFHDSFRQFLVQRTIIDDRAVHRRIARWFESVPGSAELLYHRLKAGDEDDALALATFGYFRGQLTRRRPPEAIEADVRTLAGVAAARHDVAVLVRLMFIAAEMEHRAIYMDRSYLVRVLAGLGDADAVIAFADQPAHAGDRERVRLDASLALARAGAEEAASRLLDEESSDLFREPGSFAREWMEDARIWGRACARLLQAPAIAEVVVALRNADANSAAIRVGAFVAAAVGELVEAGELDLARAVASYLDLDAEGEADARAKSYVSILETYRLTGQDVAHASLALSAVQELRGRPLSQTTLYQLLFELAAARVAEVPEIVNGLDGPGPVDLTRLEGFGRYLPAMWWTAVCAATGAEIDLDRLRHELGAHADARVTKVAHALGQVLGSTVVKPLDVWTFREKALEIIRSFVLGRNRRPMDDYPLEEARFGAHDALIQAATYLGHAHLDALLSLLEDEWARPHVGWPDELKRRILRAYLRLDRYQSRVGPLLGALNAQPPQGDVTSRFVTLLDYADSWLALGERERALGAVTQALESGFGVGYRKDYQLDFWLPWLDKVGRVDPLAMPHRIAVIAGSLKELDDLTEGRATELAASSLIEVAAGWQPAAGATLLRWLLDVGAITFHGGVLALLKAAIEHDADPAAIAAFAGAWTIPLEREAETMFATALCGRLAAAGSKTGAECVRQAIQCYSQPSMRSGWAHAMRETLVPAGLLTSGAIDDLITTGFLRQASGGEGESSASSRDPELRSIEGLLSWMESAPYVSGEQLRRLVPPLVTVADSFALAGLADAPQTSPVALCIAAEELLSRRRFTEAQRLAEAALARRNPNGWDRWYDGGTVLDTVALLRQLSPARGRELAFEALGQDFASGESNAVWMLRSLDELLPHLTDEDLVREVWIAVEAYLHALLSVERATRRPDLSNLPSWSFDTALVEVATPWLAHPVTLIAQLTREAMATLTASAWQPALDSLIAQLTRDETAAAMTALSVLEAAAVQSPGVVDSIRRFVEPHMHSPMLDVRLAACRLLDQPVTSILADPRATLVPAIYRISLPPTSGRLTGRRLAPEVGEPVRDTGDVFEMVGAFEDEVRMLATASGLDAAAVAHRVIQIARDLGLEEQLGESGERALQSALKSAYLEYPYVRPRSQAVRVALGHVAAEMLDYGLLDAASLARLENRFRWTDGAFDALRPAPAPAWLQRPIRGDDDHGPIGEWVGQVRCDARALPRTSFGFVIAEATTVRSLDWSRPTERRRRTLVPAADAGAVAVSGDELLGPVTLLLADYARARDPDGPFALRGFTMRFQSTKAPWVTINAAAADTLGWYPDAKNLCGWADRDGKRRIKSGIWMDGTIEAPSPELYDQPGRGAFLEAVPEALEELEGAFGRLLVVESVEREAREDGRDVRRTARLVWDWRRFT